MAIHNVCVPGPGAITAYYGACPLREGGTDPAVREYRKTANQMTKPLVHLPRNVMASVHSLVLQTDLLEREAPIPTHSRGNSNMYHHYALNTERRYCRRKCRAQDIRDSSSPHRTRKERGGRQSKRMGVVVIRALRRGRKGKTSRATRRGLVYMRADRKRGAWCSRDSFPERQMARRVEIRVHPW